MDEDLTIDGSWNKLDQIFSTVAGETDSIYWKEPKKKLDGLTADASQL